MKKKRILFIEHYAGSPEMGMEYRPYYMAREWVKMGHRVDILAADFSHLRRKNPEPGKDMRHELIDGIHYHWVHTTTYSGNGAKRAVTMAQFVGKLLLRAGRIAKRLKPDVIITSSTYTLDTFAGQWFRKKSPGSRLIHEVHDMWPATLIEVGGMSKWNPFCIAMQWGENSAYRKSDAVVSLPPLTKDYMVEHGMAPEKFCPIPNGIVPEEWENPEPLPEQHETLLRELRDRRRFVVGYFGGHSVSNALDVLLSAAEYAEERGARASFVLVGDGVDKAELMEKAEKMGLSEVFFLPAVPKTAVPTLVKWFDCTYVGAKNSSLYRFGLCMNKIFDSMMAGKPILCAITTPDDLILRNKAGVMVPSDSPQAIDAVIASWEVMPEEQLREMGEAGHAAAMDKDSYQHLAKKFAELF